jgi:hypothetical protein
VQDWVPEVEGGDQTAAQRKRLLLRFDPEEWLIDGDPGPPPEDPSPPPTRPAPPQPDVATHVNGNGAAPTVRRIELDDQAASRFAKLADEVEDRMRVVERRVALAADSIRRLR